jgi:hypothetical protein
VGLRELFRNPTQVAIWLSENPDLFVVHHVDAVLFDSLSLVLKVRFRPPTALATRGYPFEEVGILIKRDGRIFVTPMPDNRTWYHRNIDALESLCLWHPGDPAPLRWDWRNGFCAYLMIVFRHLCAEEYFRRTLTWPFEDVPHGVARPPVESPALQTLIDEHREAS